MRTAIPSTKFRKDLRKCHKRGKNISKIESVIETLLTDKELESRYRPHLLSGDWSGYSECHIEPDWLLIYRLTNSELHLVRTGTHSDLF